MKLFCIICLFFVFHGCTWFNTKTTITQPDGSKYIISSKRDSLVNYDNGNDKITVDNRGNRSAFELLFPSIIGNMRDIEVHDD